VSERELVIPHPPLFVLQKPWRRWGFFSSHPPAFRPTRAAWSPPVSRRTDGADGRFSPGLTCRSMNRLVSSPRLSSSWIGAERHLAPAVREPRHGLQPAGFAVIVRPRGPPRVVPKGGAERVSRHPLVCAPWRLIFGVAVIQPTALPTSCGLDQSRIRLQLIAHAGRPVWQNAGSIRSSPHPRRHLSDPSTVASSGIRTAPQTLAWPRGPVQPGRSRAMESRAPPGGRIIRCPSSNCRATNCR
jgi:hypothetical protein